MIKHYTDADQDQPDPTTVRTLIRSVTPLARHLGLTTNAIYRWMKVDRIPVAYLDQVAAFYGIDPPSRINMLALSPYKNRQPRPIKKSPETLAQIVEVHKGLRAHVDGLSDKSVKVTLAHWGDDIELLQTCLVESSAGITTNQEAADRLGVTRGVFIAMRSNYGFSEKRGGKAPRPPKPRKVDEAMDYALRVIAGSLKYVEVPSRIQRTVHRRICAVSQFKPIKLTAWPSNLRYAYADEIRRDLPKLSLKVWEFIQNQGISLKKGPKTWPKAVEDWRKEGTKRMITAVFSEEITLEDLAEQRGADVSALKNLFDSDLRSLGLGYNDVTEGSIYLQLAIADLYVALFFANKPTRRRVMEARNA